jgi:hypothetical protein
MASTQDAASQLASRVHELRQQIRQVDPYLLASRTGSHFSASEDPPPHFSLAMWGQPAVVTFPELVTYTGPELRQADGAVQALLAYYFITADGTLAADRWISFSELPDGIFYTHAFQGYTGGELARHFHDGGDAFAAAAVKSGGLRLNFADLAFAFQALPRVPLIAACWLGDEDFPTSYRILFDASVDHYLPTDACAILGSMLTRRIVRAKS